MHVSLSSHQNVKQYLLDKAFDERIKLYVLYVTSRPKHRIRRKQHITYLLLSISLPSLLLKTPDHITNILIQYGSQSFPPPSEFKMFSPSCRILHLHGGHGSTSGWLCRPYLARTSGGRVVLPALLHQHVRHRYGLHPRHVPGNAIDAFNESEAMAQW